MNKYFKWSFFVIYVVITFIRVLHHNTWFDESRAWLIAEYLNLFEIFDLMKSEGHTFVWYVLLMPFAKTHFAYPYSMLILNWLFCVSAVFLIWKYSPFNTFTKAVITFSSPFFILYALVARCYAIGIFLLFVLTALYRDKSKIPVIYSILILLTANTSVVAIGGAFAFAILLWLELIKTKQYKNLAISVILGLSCFTLLCLQLYGANPATTGLKNMLLGLNFEFFSNVFVFPSLILNLTLLTAFSVITIICLKKSICSSLFLGITYVYLLSVFHFVYLGESWHHYFFFVYFIIAVWLYRNEEKVSDFYKIILTSVLILVSIFYCIDLRFKNGVFNSGSKIIADKIIELGKSSSIIFVGKEFFKVLPYIETKDIDYYYSCKSEKVNNPIKEEKSITKIINPDIVAKIYKKNQNTYVFILNEEYPLNSFKIPAEDGIYELNITDVYGDCVYIFKVNKM